MNDVDPVSIVALILSLCALVLTVTWRLGGER
ncbi:hypothetical protein SEA_ROBINROSE_6 [Microbacterium phage RobinRose]|nr:hypothetical protein SEA_ROBINROSE_6 [Microbacterium phage RobinRose]WNN94033.1 membrane protein [Microbacterium phage Fregley]WNT44318.1 hypothetical protein SEA_CANDC_5 [Microbacterium phage CandC]